MRMILPLEACARPLFVAQETQSLVVSYQVKNQNWGCLELRHILPLGII